MLNVIKVSSTIILAFGMDRSGIERRSSAPMANTLIIMPISVYPSVSWKVHKLKSSYNDIKICRWGILWPLGYKSDNIDARSVSTARSTMLKSKLHLPTFQVNIFVGQYIFQYIYIYIKMNWSTKKFIFLNHLFYSYTCFKFHIAVVRERSITSGGVGFDLYSGNYGFPWHTHTHTHTHTHSLSLSFSLSLSLSLSLTHTYIHSLDTIYHPLRSGRIWHKVNF